MLTCTRRIQFCAGHRVMGHENKCSNLHGHNWVAEITARAMVGLDKVGRVVDFSVLKQRYGDWIDAAWDHGMILHAADQWFNLLSSPQVPFTKLFAFDRNPTSENLAEHLLRLGPELMQGTAVEIVHVRLYETENCWSEADQ